MTNEIKMETEKQVGVPKNWQTKINQGLKHIDYLRRQYNMDDGSVITCKVSELSPVLYGTFPPIADFRLFVDINIRNQLGTQREFNKVYLGGIVYDSDSRSNHPHGEKYFDDVKSILEHLIHSSFDTAKQTSLQEETFIEEVGRGVK